ncbi:DoxX family protein [Streptomyces boninensis]|uniref:DoxX family protein n=1 Tax=Streptomyces boninensis TaxID=2039455 RepID=UPI003B228895
MATTPREFDLSFAAAQPRSATTRDVGLLLLRLVLGVIMVGHGTQKLFGYFNGPGLDKAGLGFKAMGYPAGKTMAAIAGLSETLGGVGLIFGFLTPLAAAAVLGTMMNAMAVHWGGFFAPKGLEYELMLAAAAAALCLTGPGRLSVDNYLPRLRDESRAAHRWICLLLGLVLGAVVLLIKG